MDSEPYYLPTDFNEESAAKDIFCEKRRAQYVDKILAEFLERYAKDSNPIQVNFRKLVHWEKYSESYTHYIHKYPAKLLKHIPIFFLRSNILLNKRSATILDPFCGTGTVMLESLLAGHNAIGCDANPIARLISEIKTAPPSPNTLKKHAAEVVARAKRYRSTEPRNVINIDHWFPVKTQSKLGRLARSIDQIKNRRTRMFFEVSLSSTVQKCSFADPSVSVPVKLNAAKYKDKGRKEKALLQIAHVESLDVFEVFTAEVSANIKRISSIYNKGIKGSSKIIGDDAKNVGTFDNKGKKKKSSSVDLILTSPPYAGAQKYVRATSLNLGWLNFCREKTLRDYERKSMGRENYSVSEYNTLVKTGIDEIDGFLERISQKNSLRAHINGNYLLEMELAIKEMHRLLRKDGYCILVIGNNEVCGEHFNTQHYISLLAEKHGFSTKLKLVDDITSRGLMTKRNRTASIINSEWILVFQK